MSIVKFPLTRHPTEGVEWPGGVNQRQVLKRLGANRYEIELDSDNHKHQQAFRRWFAQGLIALDGHKIEILAEFEPAFKSKEVEKLLADRQASPCRVFKLVEISF